MITPILQRALSERIILAPAIRAPEIAWRDLPDVHGWALQRPVATKARLPSRSARAGRSALDGLDRTRKPAQVIGHRWFEGADKFSKSGLRRPIDVGDRCDRHGDQDKNLHQQGRKDSPPINAAALSALPLR
jgi:hypothetical protein